MNLFSPWIVPDWDVPNHVKAVTTTKQGGVSNGSYASMNLAQHVGDDAAIVAQNRECLMQKLQLSNEPVWLNQVHSNYVMELQLHANSKLPEDADGSVSRQAGLVCAVMTADCLPLLLSNRQGTCVAAVHAGWRGLAAGIIENAVQVMQCSSSEIFAWLGPAIGPLAFEVGDDVRDKFIAYNKMAEQAFMPYENGKWLANIYMLAQQRLNKLGIRNISGGSYCTYRQDSLFYSYRRDKTTGRMASLIWME